MLRALCCSITIFIEVLHVCSSALLDICSPAFNSTSGCRLPEKLCFSSPQHHFTPRMIEGCYTGMRDNTNASFHNPTDNQWCCYYIIYMHCTTNLNRKSAVSHMRRTHFPWCLMEGEKSVQAHLNGNQLQCLTIISRAWSARRRADSHPNMLNGLFNCLYAPLATETANSLQVTGGGGE